MQLAVSELDQQYPGKVLTANVDATTPESKQAVEELGFNNHGLVIRCPEGEALWSQADHTVVMDEVKAELERLIANR